MASIGAIRKKQKERRKKLQKGTSHRKPKYFNPAQWAIFKRVVAPNLKFETMFRLGCAGCMRVGEIAQLELKHLSWDDMGRLKLTIPPENTKGGKSGREVVLGGEIPLKVQQYLNIYKYKKGFVFRSGYSGKNRPYSERAIRKAFKIFALRVGLPADLAHPHTLKHTGVILRILMGRPPTTIMQDAGHTSLKMIEEVYGKLIAEDRLTDLGDIGDDVF